MKKKETKPKKRKKEGVEKHQQEPEQPPIFVYEGEFQVFEPGYGTISVH